jgi:hypothetical protein
MISDEDSSRSVKDNEADADEDTESQIPSGIMQFSVYGGTEEASHIK